MEIKNKRLVVVMMTISFVLIIAGSVSTVFLGLRADREETLKRVSVISDQFEVFSTNTSAFEAMRDELYESILGDVYYDVLKEQDKEIKNKLSNYENLVDELEKNVVKLDSFCTNVYYPDSTTNSRCHNYKAIYEQVNNYFISDINLYNKEIEKYNEYQKEANSTQSLRRYDINKKYIDYNGDKKYEGKE